MNIILYTINGMNIGISEIMIVLLGIFVLLLIIRNLLIQPKD